jgi:hypothetical protein
MRAEKSPGRHIVAKSLTDNQGRIGSHARTNERHIHLRPSDIFRAYDLTTTQWPDRHGHLSPLLNARLNREGLVAVPFLTDCKLKPLHARGASADAAINGRCHGSDLCPGTYANLSLRGTDLE